jgi:hypothetical protein
MGQPAPVRGWLGFAVPQTPKREAPARQYEYERTHIQRMSTVGIGVDHEQRTNRADEL